MGIYKSMMNGSLSRKQGASAEIVAAITAAISAYTNKPFTIKSIEKANTSKISAWSAAAKRSYTNPF